MNERKSTMYYQEIIALLDNMERAAEMGSSIGYEARKLLHFVEQYGFNKALEARIDAGFPPLEPLSTDEDDNE